MALGGWSDSSPRSRDVLEHLRPAALGELGIYGAIDRGSIRSLAENAGLAFDVELQGDARLLSLLGEAHAIAAYRLAQGGCSSTCATTASAVPPYCGPATA